MLQFHARRPTPREELSNESSWDIRTEMVPIESMAEFERYPSVTAHGLRGRTERPRRVKMLMRDFIHGNGTRVWIRSVRWPKR